ncbi:MAG: two-component sensor [Gammaproteobacteria bacterium]|nr:two-component sensor [Gammaproteobacteria bacterium]
MRQLEFFRTTSFRWTIAFAAVFAIGMGLLSGIIYWQTASFITRRVDTELRVYAQVAARQPSLAANDPLLRFFEDDPERVKIAGLFDAAGHPLAGNLRQIPSGLPPLGVAGDLEIRPATGTPEIRSLRVLTERLPDGRLLVLGRSVTVVQQIDEIVRRGLLLSLIPMLLLALMGGVLLSHAALRRIAEVHSTSRQIMAGQLSKRLPVRGSSDDFDKLARIVNEMLDEIERLMLQAKGAGEDIAHDLRTPLTRLRGRLERALSAGPGAPDVNATLVTAIEDIDQILGTITAILRIAEVDHGLRRAAFREVDLADVVREATDLYEPIAEEKAIVIDVSIEKVGAVKGDGDLLFEAVANLLDNAIKFTPRSGHVEVSIRAGEHGTLVRVRDSGPGIPAGDFPKVLRRFYRADRSRHTPGTGLGLSLVASIARLHGFGLVLDDRDAGCCIAIECWQH